MLQDGRGAAGVVGVGMRDQQHIGAQGVGTQQRQEHALARIAGAAIASAIAPTIARPGVIQQAVARGLYQHRIALAHIDKSRDKLPRRWARGLVGQGRRTQGQHHAQTAMPPKRRRLLLAQGQMRQHRCHGGRTRAPGQGGAVQHGLRPGRTPV